MTLNANKILTIILVTSASFLYLYYTSQTNDEVEEFFTFFHNDSNNNVTNLFWELMNAYNQVEDTKGCHLPDYDPWDPSVLKYLQKKSAINCGHPQYPLTSVDDLGNLQVNASAVDEAGLSLSKLKCEFMEVIRVENENKVKYGKPVAVNMTGPNTIQHEFVLVQCNDELRKNSLVYKTVHMRVKPLRAELYDSSKKLHEEGAYNVIIMMLDSMSRLNMMRQLPKTMDYLEKQMNAVVMKGNTKVQENTLPNALTFLADLVMIHKSFHIEDEIPGPYFELSGSHKFDNVTFLWNHFSKKGFVTIFADDDPFTSTFNGRYYRLNGFKKVPTDYYLRPMMVALETMKKFKSSDRRCFSHEPKNAFLFNYTERVAQKLHRNGNAFFAVEIQNALSHGDLNMIQVIDDVIVERLERFKASGLLNNTLFIMLGDHGQRIHKFRESVIGGVEDRMPFLAVSLPKRLEHFRKNLEKNSKIVTAWHDVYETAMDVCNDNLKPESKVVRYGNHGFSLFREIRANRTCREAGVPDEYCVCNVEHKINPDSAHALTAANAIIEHINKNFVKDNLTSLCAELSLGSIENVQFSVDTKMVKDFTYKKFIFIRVVLTTLPSNALFEGLYKMSETGYEIFGNVNRINLYGNQSHCIDLKKFKSQESYCYCNPK